MTGWKSVVARGELRQSKTLTGAHFIKVRQIDCKTQMNIIFTASMSFKKNYKELIGKAHRSLKIKLNFWYIIPR